MLKANERRQKILEILCVRRQETMENLAQEFNVTIRTIRNDIEELTLAGMVIGGNSGDWMYLLHTEKYMRLPVFCLPCSHPAGNLPM